MQVCALALPSAEQSQGKLSLTTADKNAKVTGKQWQLILRFNTYLGAHIQLYWCRPQIGMGIGEHTSNCYTGVDPQIGMGIGCVLQDLC